MLEISNDTAGPGFPDEFCAPIGGPETEPAHSVNDSEFAEDYPARNRLRRSRSIIVLHFSRPTRRFLLRHGIKNEDELQRLGEDFLTRNGASPVIVEELRPYFEEGLVDASGFTNVPNPQVKKGIDEDSAKGGDDCEIDLRTTRFVHLTLEDYLAMVGVDEVGITDDSEDLRKASSFLLTKEGADIAIHSTNSVMLASIARDAMAAYDCLESSGNEAMLHRALLIESLGFARRVKTVARRKGLRTVGDLCDIGTAEFHSYRGVGIDTVNNVLEVLGALDGNLAASFKKDAVATPSDVLSKTDRLDGRSIDIRLNNLPLRVDNLSARARRSLRIAGIDTVATVLEMGVEGLRKIRNAGAMTAAEIYTEASRQGDEFLSACLDTASTDGVVPIEKQAEAAESRQNTQPAIETEAIRSHLYELAQFAVVSPLAISRLIEERTYEASAMRIAVEDSLTLSVLEANPWGLSDSEALACIVQVDGCADSESVGVSLGRLRARGLAGEEDGLWNRDWPNLADALSEKIDDEYRLHIMMSRIEGKTLQEIGDEQGISKERVRQIVSKTLVPDILRGTRAEKYLDVMDRYTLNEREVRYGLGATEMEWSVLSLVADSRKGKRLLPPTELLKDSAIPLRVRINLESEIYHGYVKVRGEYVKKARLPLMLYTLKTYGSESAITEDELLGYYRSIIDGLGLSDDKDLAIAERYVDSFRLQRCVLSGYWKRLRYYDINQYDLDMLIASLGFEEFKDQEISTQYFLQNKPDLLDDYDINDAYELHSLLRTYANQAKSCGKRVPYEMTRRMPVIRIGNANRKNQVVELARELSPIRCEDFARAYEEKYGVEQPTVMANYVKYVSEYVANGVITMGLPPFTEEESRRMSELLPGDYYGLSHVEQVYKEEFPDAGTDRMNSLSLLRMGFRVYSSYVLRSKWKTYEEYFDSLVLAGDFFEEKDLPLGVAKSRQYEFYRYCMLRDRKMLPYDRDSFITRKGLGELGITDCMLLEFAMQSASFCEERSISYCTAQSLENAGFKHDLLSYDMSNDFYVAALCSEGTRFTTLRCSNERVACLDDARVSIAGMVDAFVDADESIALDELSERVHDSLGVTLRRDKIVAAPLRSKLYYSSATDMMYKDRETFVRQVL